MNTITIAEFEALTTRTEDWTQDQDINLIESNVYAFGVAWVTSALKGIKITWTEVYSYDEWDLDSFSPGGGNDDEWKIEGVTVIDEDCDEVSSNELGSHLDRYFSSIDYTEVTEEIKDKSAAQTH